jgi:hypothetical protein
MVHLPSNWAAHQDFTMLPKSKLGESFIHSSGMSDLSGIPHDNDAACEAVGQQHLSCH